VGRRAARAPEFRIVVSIDERVHDAKPKIFVVVDQMLAEFEEDVLNRYTVDLWCSSLMYH